MNEVRLYIENDITTGKEIGKVQNRIGYSSKTSIEEHEMNEIHEMHDICDLMHPN